MAWRWGDAENIAFINLYKFHENLWNVFHSEYKNKDARLASLEHIAQSMNMPGLSVNEVSKKIRNLRSTYHQEMVKIMKSRESGNDHVYTPNVKWFNVMHYIMKNGSRKRESYLCMEESSTLDVEVKVEEILPDTDTLVDPISTGSSYRKNYKRRHFGYEEIENNNGIGQSDHSRTEDEFDVMGRYIAMQLRQLTLNDVFEAKTEILGIIGKYRQKHQELEETQLIPNDTSTPTPNPSFVTLKIENIDSPVFTETCANEI